MSSVDLVILGFIKKGASSAYDLAKAVERTEMTKWLKIGLPTIYQNLRKLADKGYLAVDSVPGGRMPDKALYSITSSGEERWLELMNRYSSEPGNLYFDFNAFVINMGLLGSRSRLKMLENLRGHFLREIEGLRQSMQASDTAPAAGRAVMAQYELVFSALIEWIEKCIAEPGPHWKPARGAAGDGGARA